MRSLPDPGFAGDDGGVDPAVTAALAAYDTAIRADAPDPHPATLAIVQDARVLVPVVAVLGEVEYDEQGLAHDKTSDMAAVLLTGRDGRTALLAFTGSETLTRWKDDARPVPVPVRQAAQAALQDRASALVIDLAGPVQFVIEEEDLALLAQGHRLLQVGDRWAWVQAAGPGDADVH